MANNNKNRLSHSRNGKEIKDNMHLFVAPVCELYSAWRLKSRGMLWCAINDMFKIFKGFESERR